MQTEGSEEVVQANSEKAQIESSLQEHKESARKSLEITEALQTNARMSGKRSELESKANQTSEEQTLDSSIHLPLC